LFGQNISRGATRKPLRISRRGAKGVLSLLAQGICHPSLRAKIVASKKRIWQIRIDGGWRLYFQIKLEIISHSK
jgi:hypothetical protein